MTDLRALLTRAGEALEPFVNHIQLRTSLADDWLTQVSLGDLRRARALHAEITAALADAPMTI